MRLALSAHRAAAGPHKVAPIRRARVMCALTGASRGGGGMKDSGVATCTTAQSATKTAHNVYIGAIRPCLCVCLADCPADEGLDLPPIGAEALTVLARTLRLLCDLGVEA